MSRKKNFLERCLQNSQKNTCQGLYFNKVRPKAVNEETLVQVFSCEFCKISKNTFFTEHLRTTVSAFSFSEAATGGVLWKNVFLKISQNSEENFFCFVKFSKTPFLHNTSGRLLLLLVFPRQSPEVSYEKRCSWKFRKIHRKTPLVCEFFKNTFFTEHLWTTPSGFFVQRY